MRISVGYSWQSTKRTMLNRIHLVHNRTCSILLVLPLLVMMDAYGQSPPLSCESNEINRQFDFWIGEWEVTTLAGQKAGENKISRAEKGCLLIERWTSAGGGTGQSYNYYDPAAEAWKQVWVDAGGNLGYFTGGLEGEAMVLKGEWISPDGSKILLNGTWTPLEDGRVRQHFVQSTDNGDNWSTWFDGYYTKKGS